MNELNGVQILGLFKAFEEYMDKYPTTAIVLDKVIVRYTKKSDALDVVITLEP